MCDARGMERVWGCLQAWHEALHRLALRLFCANSCSPPAREGPRFACHRSGGRAHGWREGGGGLRVRRGGHAVQGVRGAGGARLVSCTRSRIALHSFLAFPSEGGPTETHGSPAIAAGRAHGWRQRAIGKRRPPRWVLGGRGRLRCARHEAGALRSRVRRVGPHRLALRLRAHVPAFLRSREGGPTVGLFERERERHRAWVRVHVRCTRDGEGVGVFACMA